VVRDHQLHPFFVQVIAVGLDFVVEYEASFSGFSGVIAQLIESNRTLSCNGSGQLHNRIVDRNPALEEGKAELIVVGPPLLKGNKCRCTCNHDARDRQDGLGVHSPERLADRERRNLS
jgi:hypothetical protein